MRILIADDEPLARARLAALLGECANAELVGSVGDGEAALAACAELKPDVLLLDIELPGHDGLGIARRLAALPAPPQVVFCTAYEAHALEAYELHAADYLLKPVRVERLREALKRAEALRGGAGAPRAYLAARMGGELKRVPLDEVIYLLADDKYVAVHHSGGVLLIEDSLKALEQAHPERYARLHRNCLVPVERLLGLKTLADGRIVARLAGTEAAPEVSRRNLPALRRLLRES
ncbi:response regulator of the LytR/AlgR family [Mizugakiibacter sediminis]|uniref:Response regulator of the LytR/AlgR family n=1 Tax=Mizugakiibacter sediminis TaxID=1475481 RepID=A0A0K8QKS0_9GAMM|nr:LytTR family DNA-binding domain-containing protein [Mizugakiibacter sediminis]GAP65540.1 response regulator of the LytR/AlgR family [Mizugakiibacter sediminis]